MHARGIAILALFALSLVPGQSKAQPEPPACESWIRGPMDDGTLPNGANDEVNVAIPWDPDGAGPLQERLVVGGQFTSIGGVAALHVAQFDPATGQWQPFGGGIGPEVLSLTIFNGQIVAGCSGDTNVGTFDNTVRRWNGSAWESLSPPDLANTAFLLEDIMGESLSWGEATLETSVTSSTGTIYAVFVFPAYQERVGEGLYGGPGIGYHSSAATKGNFLSQDGIVWTQLHPGYDLAVTPLFGSGKGRPLTLAELRTENDDLMLPTPLEKSTPARTQLGSPFPNPFNPRVEIPLDLSSSGRVMLDIYNTRGRRVHALLNEARPAGHYQIPWLGVDDRGQQVASGVYYVQMSFAGETHRKRVALVR